VVMAIIALLVALILPAVQSAREASRRSVCSSNMRAVAQAVVTFESHKKRYPAVVDRQRKTAAPNADGSTGYSWIFMVLPYMEQQQIYDAVALSTSNLTSGPFNAAAISGGGPAAAEQIPTLSCPAYAGGKTTSGAVSGLGITNYKAMAGVLVTTSSSRVPGKDGICLKQPKECIAIKDEALGLIQFPSEDLGLKLLGASGASGVPDGISNTVIAAETREPRYACWVDGASCWVVAIKPYSIDPRYWKGDWSHLKPPVTIQLALTGSDSSIGVGGDTTPWLTDWRGTTWSWGPSSNHTLGVTLHSFGDAHVAAIEPGIDGRVYASISTRAGDESYILSQ